MTGNYIFYSTYFDVELLRVHTLGLNENNIEFNVIEKTLYQSAKSPLGVTFEADLHILETDLKKADEILRALNF